LWTLGSAANAKILNARPPLLPQLCLGGDQTLVSCKRFKSGHRNVGEVSGVEAVIHCGDELWFGVGMEVSEGYQSLAINTGENALGTHL